MLNKATKVFLLPDERGSPYNVCRHMWPKWKCVCDVSSRPAGGVGHDASMMKSRVRHNEINCIFNIPNFVHVQIHVFPRE